MTMFDPASYTYAAHLLPRLLGLIYFFALGALLLQIKGLIGKDGILPLKKFLEFIHFYHPEKKFSLTPTLFWINCSDRAIVGLTLVGTLLSLTLMFGYYPSLILALLFIIHLSIVTAGQDFLSFGWEGLLLEITFQTFLISLTAVPTMMVWISLNFLLLRFHLQAGTNKLFYGDSSWKDLTAIAYHYQSQPLPNTVAWYAHKLPMSFQKMSVVLMYLIEIVVPFGLFFGEGIRLFTFITLFSLQYLIWLTGNFSYLNFLTAVFLVILVSNSYLSPFFTYESQQIETPLFLEIALSAIGVILISLQSLRLWHHFSPTSFCSKIFRKLSPFHLVNTYAIFAGMTKVRYEIVVEGSEDGAEWKEYLFSYKPSEVTRRPRRIAPYQPRLDWQMWFLPFHEFESAEWFQKFLYHLLKGTPSVLQLIRYNPFKDQPPRYIRAVIYEYQFTSWAEKNSNGNWWKRSFVDFYSPMLSLRK